MWKKSWPNLRRDLRICMEVLRKIMNVLLHDTRISGRDLNVRLLRPHGFVFPTTYSGKSGFSANDETWVSGNPGNIVRFVLFRWKSSNLVFLLSPLTY
jgi:hypothetical protein